MRAIYGLPEEIAKGEGELGVAECVASIRYFRGV